MSNKIVIAPNKKRIFLSVTVMIFLLSVIGIILAMVPDTEDVVQTLGSYSVSADIAYKVHLLPNELYEELWLAEGSTYADALTDYIEMNFTSSVSGDMPADINGTYKVAAILEGYQGPLEGGQLVFQREFPLEEGKFIQHADGSLAEVSSLISLQPQMYRKQAEHAEQILQAKIVKQFYLVFSGNVILDTPHGERKQDFSHKIVIPIETGTGFYTIAKPKPILEEIKITENQSLRKPVNKQRLVLAATIGLLAITATLVLCFFSRPPNQIERWDLQRQEIIRKYSSRMSRVMELPRIESVTCVRLSDVDSLIVMAEEMRSPVFYQPDEVGLPVNGVFYLPMEKCIYVYQVEKLREEVNTTLVVQGNNDSSVMMERKA